ncbi:unnamed protein product [Adineta ricciae]|uniref:G-protein coupled receptors family 1 profile domain-containing protein n=2 Tax=Adineta ricciae TaxID=249248 RepID=A0A814SG80_ADIRI|nr:unnamed protein product [Adineta ricciae]
MSKQNLPSIYDIFNRTRKSLILCIMSGLGFLYPFDETVYLSSISIIVKEFQSTETWGVLSNFYRQRPIIIYGHGCFISITTVVAQGVISDIYESSIRETAYGIYYITYYAGVIRGPVIGGEVSAYFGWRTILIVAASISFVMCAYETQHRVLIRDSEEISQPTFVNPCAALSYLIAPTILPYGLMLSVGYISINRSFLLLPIELSKPPYSYPTNDVGLLTALTSSGVLLGSFCDGMLTDVAATKWASISRITEGLIIPGLIFSIFIVSGLTIFGWSLQYHLNAALLILSAIFFSFGHATRSDVILYYQIPTVFSYCRWLAAVDQFLITSRSVRLRQLSSIKRAHRTGIGVAVFWIVQSVPNLVFVDLRSNVCTIYNSFWQVYNAYIDFWCFYTIIPVLMMSVFGILAYRNVRVLKDMRKSQGVDRQLTHMVCGQIMLIIVYVVPYATFNAYSLATAVVIKTLEQKSVDYLVVNVTGLLSVFGAGVIKMILALDQQFYSYF